MSSMKITTAQFDEQVTRSEKPVIVDFGAPWCGYCRGIEPVFDQMAQEDARFAFGKVDIDEEMPLAERFEVMTIPTFLLFRGGVAGDKLIAPGSRGAIEDWLRAQGAL